MIYGVLITSYCKGNTNILLFKQKGLAKMIGRILDNLWNKNDVEDIDYEATFSDINRDVYATIEDVDKKNWNEVNKDVSFLINENGFVHSIISNIRLINLNSTIYVP